jgi:hypothetical protein
VAEVFVELFGSREVQTEVAQAAALGRVDRQVGDEGQVIGIEVQILGVKAELVPQVGVFLRRHALGRVADGILGSVQHAPGIERHLLLAHQLTERQQVAGVLGVELPGPTQRLVGLETLLKVGFPAAGDLAEKSPEHAPAGSIVRLGIGQFA